MSVAQHPENSFTCPKSISSSVISLSESYKRITNPIIISTKQTCGKSRKWLITYDQRPHKNKRNANFKVYSYNTPFLRAIIKGLEDLIVLLGHFLAAL